MNRIMIIPAAGTGSRLNADVPKVLAEVNHRPMLDYLLELYAPFVNRFVLVASPGNKSIIQQRTSAVSQIPFSIEVQDAPTGMLDAILVPQQHLLDSRPARIWITWCDQIAIHPNTVEKLAKESDDYPGSPLILPTTQREKPYIHFHRDDEAITKILHQREGDTMPATGESDMGLFSLSDTAYFDLLPRFANSVVTGEQTGERNFLPFIVWLEKHGNVRTINGTNHMESVGVNTQEELRMIEEWLQHG